MSRRENSGFGWMGIGVREGREEGRDGIVEREEGGGE